MPFRRVEPQLAGPGSLGILIPPAPKTLIIVRPRSLAWDLLPARWDGNAAHAPTFCQFERDEAVGIARRLLRFLEDGATAGSSPIRMVSDAAERRFQIWLVMEELVWFSCGRAPGVAYQPVLFTSKDEAVTAAETLERIVMPSAHAEQQIYVNTQRFNS